MCANVKKREEEVVVEEEDDETQIEVVHDSQLIRSIGERTQKLFKAARERLTIYQQPWQRGGVGELTNEMNRIISGT